MSYCCAAASNDDSFLELLFFFKFARLKFETFISMAAACVRAGSFSIASDDRQLEMTRWGNNRT